MVHPVDTWLDCYLVSLAVCQHLDLLFLLLFLLFGHFPVRFWEVSVVLQGRTAAFREWLYMSARIEGFLLFFLTKECCFMTGRSMLVHHFQWFWCCTIYRKLVQRRQFLLELQQSKICTGVTGPMLLTGWSGIQRIKFLVLTQDRTLSPDSDLLGLWEEGRASGRSKGVGPEAFPGKRKPLFFPLNRFKRI